MCVCWSLSPGQLLVTPWTVGHQAPLSRGFSKKEYWSGLPFPSPGDLPDPRTEPRSAAMQAASLPTEAPGATGRVTLYFDWQQTVWAYVGLSGQIY